MAVLHRFYCTGCFSSRDINQVHDMMFEEIAEISDAISYPLGFSEEEDEVT